MGIKASNTAEVSFEDVRIPVENVLGGGCPWSWSVYLLDFNILSVAQGHLRAI